MAGVIDALKSFRLEENGPTGEIIMGYGHDETPMADGKLLNRDHPDTAFPDNPLIVMHVSLHGGVLKSLALRIFLDTTRKRLCPLEVCE